MDIRKALYMIRARQAWAEEWSEPRRRAPELYLACRIEAFCNNLSLEMCKKEGKIKQI